MHTLIVSVVNLPGDDWSWNTLSDAFQLNTTVCHHLEITRNVGKCRRYCVINKLFEIYSYFLNYIYLMTVNYIEQNFNHWFDFYAITWHVLKNQINGRLKLALNSENDLFRVTSGTVFCSTHVTSGIGRLKGEQLSSDKPYSMTLQQHLTEWIVKLWRTGELVIIKVSHLNTGDNQAARFLNLITTSSRQHRTTILDPADLWNRKPSGHTWQSGHFAFCHRQLAFVCLDWGWNWNIDEFYFRIILIINN